MFVDSCNAFILLLVFNISGHNNIWQHAGLKHSCEFSLMTKCWLVQLPVTLFSPSTVFSNSELDQHRLSDSQSGIEWMSLKWDELWICMLCAVYSILLGIECGNVKNSWESRDGLEKRFLKGELLHDYQHQVELDRKNTIHLQTGSDWNIHHWLSQQWAIDLSLKL